MASGTRTDNTGLYSTLLVLLVWDSMIFVDGRDDAVLNFPVADMHNTVVVNTDSRVI